MYFPQVSMRRVPEHDPVNDRITVVLKRFTSPPTYWNASKKAWDPAVATEFPLSPQAITGWGLYYDGMIDAPEVPETTVMLIRHSRFDDIGQVVQKAPAMGKVIGAQVFFQ